MLSTYEKMERCFSDNEHLKQHCLDENWRVRYAAAVAMGEDKDTRWIPYLVDMLRLENSRPLYTQPPSEATNPTRESEHIGPLEDPFPNVPEDVREAWKSRGRVKAAAADAIAAIGTATPELLELLYGFLTNDTEDFSVKAATANALGAIGNPESLPYLKALLDYNEWCTATEANKAIQAIKGAAL